MVTQNRALAIFYFNRANGLRRITGTFPEIK